MWRTYELTVDVAANGDGALDGLYVGLFHQDFPGLEGRVSFNSTMGERSDMRRGERQERRHLAIRVGLGKQARIRRECGMSPI